MNPGRPDSGAPARRNNRRDFLRHAIAGAACLPSITLLPGCQPASRDKPPAKAADGKKVEYDLAIGRQVGSPDGRQRQLFCLNDQLPGPLIRARLGETLRIRVANNLNVPSTLHWHGMHQPGTWQMDGVADVSGPPIPPGGEFIYEFEATPAGTHWYHSHVGVQYGDGLFGPLIIDEQTPPFEYDREAVLLINDWFLEPSEKILAALLASPAGQAMPQQDSALKAAEGEQPKMKEMPAGKMSGMKGMGDKPDVGDVPFESFLFNGRGRFDDQPDAPLTTLEVHPGETLRLRLINGSSTYAFRFQIDGHRLSVVASDGAPIVPVEVDNLQINVGERYDVLLKADQSGAAWIRAATLAGGEGRAILRYAGSPADEPAVTDVVWGGDALQPAAARSPAPVSLTEKPREIRWTLGGSMVPYRWTINGEEYPKADPVALKSGEEVRFVIENPTGMDHPFHLHGHYFYVLGAPDNLNLHDPPQKDTVNVPAGQTLVLQWHAINPGHWFFHCHIEWHAAAGMARVIEIG